MKALGVTEVTYARWRQELGVTTTAQAKHLKELERENGQLRGLVVDLTLDISSSGANPELCRLKIPH